MRKARHDKKPFHNNKWKISFFGDDPQHDEDIKQDWYLELILEAIADLLGTIRPRILAERNVPPIDRMVLEKAGPFLLMRKKVSPI
jgi:hypothetical protein